MTVECDILFHARLHWVCVLPPLYQGGGVALSYIHPDPLPQGEGTARIAHWKADNAGPFFAVGMVTLSPRERAGVRGNRPLPSANVLNLSCDRCPEGYIPTC